MPSGHICFRCSEFTGSYNPYLPGNVNYWFCRAGQIDGNKKQVSEDSGLPAACPNKFEHALADVRMGRKIPEIMDGD